VSLRELFPGEKGDQKRSERTEVPVTDIWMSSVETKGGVEQCDWEEEKATELATESAHLFSGVGFGVWQPSSRERERRGRGVC